MAFSMLLRRPLSRLHAAIFSLAVASASSLSGQNPAVFVKISSDQLAANATPTAATTLTIPVAGSGWAYSAAAPFAGTTWNVVNRPNPVIQSNVTNGSNGTYVLANINNLSLVDPSGAATPVTITGSMVIADLESGSTRTEPNAGTGSADTSLGPKGLMEKPWRVYRGGNSVMFKFSGLTAGANYYLFFYGSTNGSAGSMFTLDAANVPSGFTANAISTSGSATGNVLVSDGTNITPTTPATANTASANGQNTVWGRLQATVAGDGSITFRTAKNAQNNQYFNGVQLIPYPLASISIQPPATPAATAGSSVNISVTASGDGTLTYQWRKNGAAIAGNASATTTLLTLTNVQAGDAGSYDVVITNPGGSVTSSAAVLSVGTSSIAPSITTQPVNRTATVNSAVSFTVTANGTSPLSVQWQKSNDNVTFANISGATATLLSFSSTQTSDAGYYRAVVTNSVGSATSSAATLVVAPVITTQPASTVVTAGSTHTISVVTDTGAGAPEPTTYVWKRDGTTVANGSGVSGATTASLQITGFSAAQSGYYTVTATNSAGSVTSSSVYVGIPSTQTITFAPGNNATGLSIDQQLRLVFPSAPKLGQSGALRIRDASNDAVVVTIDTAQLITYTLFSATVVNGATQTVQGKALYYMPVAIYGNEVWLTLPVAQRLAYGKTYYVTMDAGFLIDSTNAVVPAITSPTAWRFSTKASGPATPTTSTGPTEITVGLDGTADFATIQGAADWIPQNNTLPRTIRVKPGVYRDLAYFAQNRNFVTLLGDGATRRDVKILYHYPAEVYAGAARGLGSLRIDSNDVTVRNLTVDDEVYIAVPSLAGGSNPSAPAFAGPIQTVASTGLRLVFDNVLIKGGQDTLYTISGITYFNNCEIWGSVDFIYGDALAVFDSCDIVQIRDTGGPICAPSTPYAQPYGEVFLNCRFPRALVANGYPYNVNVGSTTFCRPWRQDGMVAIINSQLDTHISTKAWSEWDGRENTMRAREYGNTLIGGGAASTPAQRQAAGAYWLNTVDPDYTNASMLPTDTLLVSPGGITNRQPVTVNPADYTLSAIFGHAYFALNGWLPSLAPAAPVFSTQPATRTVSAGTSVHFHLRRVRLPHLPVEKGQRRHQRRHVCVVHNRLHHDRQRRQLYRCRHQRRWIHHQQRRRSHGDIGICTRLLDALLPPKPSTPARVSLSRPPPPVPRPISGKKTPSISAALRPHHTQSPPPRLAAPAATPSSPPTPAAPPPATPRR
ncbi:MAG: pectinesterase family protein [Nibricoccus sp.]